MLKIYIFLFLFFNYSFSQNTKIESTSLIKVLPDSIGINYLTLDLNNFPEINLIVEIPAKLVDNFKMDKIRVFQNSKQQNIKSIEPISFKNRVPIDFVFVLDITASMNDKIEQVKNNIKTFALNLLNKGIDYNLGLITFSDIIENVYPPSNNIKKFVEFLEPIKIVDGGDFPENALEALYAAYKYPYRENTKRIVILITDALFHTKEEPGDGKTNFNLPSIIDTSRYYNIINYSIAPRKYLQYDSLSRFTKGKLFDIRDNFNEILDTLGMHVSKLYSIKYIYSEKTLPDSVDIKIDNLVINKTLFQKTTSLINLNQKIILESRILFKYNKSNIEKEYLSNLDRIASLLSLRNTIEIEIRGHTDDIGSEEYNQILSEGRAKSVKEYFVTKGINPNRIYIKGFGKTEPIAPNDTEDGRQLNRRIEIVIMKK